ncbi:MULTISPECIES: DNA repair protein RecO [unclassified Endozoicomonas]|uniref:DNA repair protein RecO n=2 Tax=Endozoicomonas TaxID=305899 RepID=UPI0021479734|nr:MULTISPECIES: DNA repair protein RecO [unclassified Endozoicomonas]
MNELSAAWMLHSRPYKERSVIAEFLVKDHGRIAMVIRGVRQTKSRSRAVQPFTRLFVSWRGRSELKTLSSFETADALHLKGQSLYCGFYMNELLMRSLLPGQPLDGLFELYSVVLEQLTTGAPLQPLLRVFEIELLEMTGYAPSLTSDAASGADIQPDLLYEFKTGVGFLPVLTIREKDRPRYFSGELLVSLAERRFDNVQHFPGFKRLTRLALAPLVGEKPLKSREFFLTREKFVS